MSNVSRNNAQAAEIRGTAPGIRESLLAFLIAWFLVSLGGCAGSARSVRSGEPSAGGRLQGRESAAASEISDREYASQEPFRREENLIESLVQDAKYVAESPARWKKSQWTQAALVAGAMGGAMLLDEEIRDLLQDNRGRTSDGIADWVEPFGSEVSVGIVLASYAGGWLFGSARLEKFGRLSLESTIISAGMTAGLKSLFGRARPPEEDGAYSFIGPTLDGSHMSLPSGHATQAFAVASVAGEVYRDIPYVRVGAYALAGAVAWSRLNDDRHWTSDVILGGTIGTAIGRAIVSRHERREPASIVLVPFVGPREAGLYFVMPF